MTSSCCTKLQSNYFSIKETYPSTPPVWFADVEDPLITNAVQILSNTSGSENHVSVNLKKRLLARH